MADFADSSGNRKKVGWRYGSVRLCLKFSVLFMFTVIQYIWGSKMRNLKYAVVASFLLFSGVAIAGTVKTLNIQTSPGVVTEVLLPPGVHTNLVIAYGPYYHFIRIHSGKGASYQGWVAIVQKDKNVNSDVVINASNGNAYIIWTHNINHTPAKVVYNIH